jgi:MFS family permease
LFVAGTVSNLGDGLSLVAYPWLTSAVSRDPIVIAGVGLVRFLPWLVFTLPAGVITDRVDRRKLVAWMDVIRLAVTLAVGLVVLGSQSGLGNPDEIASGVADPPPNAVLVIVVLYASALAFGIAEVLRDNAAQTMLPSIVAKDQLEKANGRMWSAEMVMNTFVGPPLAGPLLAAAFALPFFIDAGSFAVAAGLVFTIGGAAFTRPEQPRSERSMRGELVEGFRWLWHNLFLRRLAIALGITNGLGNLAFATFVLFAQEELGLGAVGFGLIGTGFAVGGILGGLAGSKVSERAGPGVAILGSLLVFGVAEIVTGVTASAVLFWALGVIQGFSSTVWNVITVSLRQQIIPDRLLGRVNSVYRFFGWGMIPIGTGLGGLISQVVEDIGGRTLALRLPWIVAGLGNLALMVWAWSRLNSRTVEAARAAADDTPGPAG